MEFDFLNIKLLDVAENLLLRLMDDSDVKSFRLLFLCIIRDAERFLLVAHIFGYTYLYILCSSCLAKYNTDIGTSHDIDDCV